MATNNNEYKDKFNKKRKSTGESTHKVKIVAKGTDAIFETAENTEEAKVESQPTPEIAPKKPTKTTATTSRKKKTTAAKTKPAPVEEKKGGELIKTSIYIEEENFLAMEELQLKLKRKEKRRVTKNELFNNAIELLIEHYSD